MVVAKLDMGSLSNATRVKLPITAEVPQAINDPLMVKAAASLRRLNESQPFAKRRYSNQATSGSIVSVKPVSRAQPSIPQKGAIRTETMPVRMTPMGPNHSANAIATPEGGNHKDTVGWIRYISAIQCARIRANKLNSITSHQPLRIKEKEFGSVNIRVFQFNQICSLVFIKYNLYPI